MPAVTASSAINTDASIDNLVGSACDAKRCSNPFRIPRHIKSTGLRKVPQMIRERLAHVHFGHKICYSCRQRTYTMLKDRKYLKPSARLQQSNNGSLDRRRSVQPTQPARTQQPRKSEPPTFKHQTVTASTEEDKKAMESLFVDERLVASSSGASCAASNLEVESSALLAHAMSRRTRCGGGHQPPPQEQQQLHSSHPDLDGPVKQICCFCGLEEDNEVEFGKFYQYHGIVTHYYCLLLSSNMEQKGNDDEGILGFLADDIQKEIKRGKRLVCSYCKKNGATLGCCNAKCKRIFHFPCGLKAGSLHQFFGEFRSYCINHRPKQKIDDRVKKEIENMKNILCYICYEDVEPLDSNGTLWAPCCKKNAWFHRKCVQQLAMSAGYFFKCPLCNNKREFQTAMLEYGIYIPRQDASWELVPNAFEELLYRHDRCDATACLCPKGRMFTSNNAKWELVLCRMCGSQGTHIFCGRLKWANPEWECQECITILKKPTDGTITTVTTIMTDDSSSNSNEIPIQRETTLNVTIRECDDDSDSDISVGNESIPLESNLTNIPIILPQIKLRPGPRSFKLQQVQKLQSSSESYKEIIKQTNNSLNKSNIPISNTASNSLGVPFSAVPIKVSNEVICIDSDEEAVEIVCENVMRSTIRNRKPLNNVIGESSSNLLNQPNLINNVSPKITSELPEETDDSPFNIIISNVTSVPPEFFASVPESSEDFVQELARDSPIEILATSSTNGLKRTLPNDDENECLIVKDASKRPRLENNATTNNINSLLKQATKIVTEGDDSLNIAKTDSVDTTIITNIKQSPGKTAGETPTLSGSNGSATSTLDNCHGDAGTRPAILCTNGQFHAAGAYNIAVTNNGDLSECHTIETESKADRPLLNIRTVLDNGSGSHCSSSGSSGGSSKSRNSSGDRSGLIPDFVHLSDLKFRICGSDLELSYRTCRIQVKMNDLHSNSTTLNDTNSVPTTTMSPFAESNQHLSSEKSSKSFPLRSDDSTDESDRIPRSLRARSLRNFVYEDDNTLLEYPTSASEMLNNVKKQTDKMIGRSDLKENWDPEISSSNNNDFDSAIIGNNRQLGSVDIKDTVANNREKSDKIEENGFSQSQKEELNIVQRHLRRSSRIIRHFRSVQQSKLNGHVNGDSTDSNTTNNNFSPSLGKFNQILPNDPIVRSSRSLKVLNGSTDVTELLGDKKHLKNVDIKELKFTLTGKINGANNNNDADKDADFKISIDLQKIRNLISAKPDLFFKTKNNGVKRLCVYSMDEKLKVEFKPGNTKFLTKSQSFDCLLNIANDDFSYFTGKSRSLNSLSNLDSHDLMPLTDIKDCMEIKPKRHQRLITRQSEKYECVR